MNASADRNVAQLSLNKAALPLGTSLKEGGFVFVRVLGKTDGGKTLVSFAGNTFAVDAKINLQTGDSFRAQIQTQNGTVLLVPQPDDAKSTSGMQTANGANALSGANPATSTQNANGTRAVDSPNLLNALSAFNLPNDELSKNVIRYIAQSAHFFSKSAVLRARTRAESFLHKKKAVDGALFLEEKSIFSTEDALEKLLSLTDGEGERDSDSHDSGGDDGESNGGNGTECGGNTDEHNGNSDSGANTPEKGSSGNKSGVLTEEPTTADLAQNTAATSAQSSAQPATEAAAAPSAVLGVTFRAQTQTKSSTHTESLTIQPPSRAAHTKSLALPPSPAHAELLAIQPPSRATQTESQSLLPGPAHTESQTATEADTTPSSVLGAPFQAKTQTKSPVPPFFSALYQNAESILSLPAGLLTVLNHVSTGGTHWIVLPYQKQIGTSLYSGSIRIKCNKTSLCAEKMYITAKNERKSLFFEIFPPKNKQCVLHIRFATLPCAPRGEQEKLKEQLCQSFTIDKKRVRIEYVQSVSEDVFSSSHEPIPFADTEA